MQKTDIQYLTHTWNPIAMCCTPDLSDGCDNYWHRQFAKRHAGNPAFSDEVRAAYAGGEPALRKHELGAPLRRKKPAVIGVQFMGDLFHEKVSDELINHAWTVMAEARHHRFMVLTKRPERIHNFLAEYRGNGYLGNLTIGVSASNQSDLDRVVPPLLECPAACKVLSLEPLLGEIVLPSLGYTGPQTMVDGIIAGGETGPGARPCHPDWVRSVRDQCEAASVAFYFKSWGEWAHSSQMSMEESGHLHRDRQAKIKDTHYSDQNTLPVGWKRWWESPGYSSSFRVGPKNAGRLLDGKEWSDLPKGLKP